MSRMLLMGIGVASGKGAGGLVLGILLSCLQFGVALAEQPARLHALSLVGPPKCAANFDHFDWVNPNAPKGGKLRQRAIGTFDNLNDFAPRGNSAIGLQLVYDTLMVTSLDEPATDYGLVAEWVSVAEDDSAVTFSLRPEARFNDGTPITPEDVIFSLSALKAANPRYALYYKNVVRAEKVGTHEVTFIFDSPNNRELPQTLGGMPILPRHFWLAKGVDGQPRDLARTSLEVPLGSGPYRISEVDPGRSLTYERVKDYWAKDLPVARGQWNFDDIQFIYYRDRLAAFEEFKVGKTDFWAEASAKGWATQYDFEAVHRGLIKKELLKSATLKPMQGFAFNVRRKQFQDPRVRQAFNLAFDFEWANRSMMFDLYKRVGSYFESSELKATGLPHGRELELLEAVRTQVPPEVFTQEYRNPVNLTPEDFRRHMAQAQKLLAAAGWTPKSGILTNAHGDQLTAEFLLAQPDFERLVHAYKHALGKLGIKASVRIVDSTQYRQRVDTFDFDIVVASFRQSLSPGNEERDFWGSEAADKSGARNVIGIKNPAVDALVDGVIFAKDRPELVAATRALDRVLLWNHYLVPHFYSPDDRVAYWNRFGRPEKLPTATNATTQFIQVWWHDEAAAVRLAEARKQ